MSAALSALPRSLEWLARQAPLPQSRDQALAWVAAGALVLLLGARLLRPTGLRLSAYLLGTGLLLAGVVRLVSLLADQARPPTRPRPAAAGAPGAHPAPCLGGLDNAPRPHHDPRPAPVGLGPLPGGVRSVRSLRTA